MNTPSHWLMTIAAGRFGPWKKIPKWSLGLGSLAPDIPLYILSFGGIFYYSVIQKWPNEKTFPHLYADNGLYFNDPVWISLHNVLHSPTSLILLFLVAMGLQKSRPIFARWMKFFLSACLFHSIVDVLTHHDDGPLLFFPLEWKTRFISPVSYWDSSHYGSTFMPLELALDVFIAVALLFSLFKRKSAEATKES